MYFLTQLSTETDLWCRRTESLLSPSCWITRRSCWLIVAIFSLRWKTLSWWQWYFKTVWEQNHPLWTVSQSLRLVQAPRCLLPAPAIWVTLVRGDVAFAGSFIAARWSSGVMFVNTAAMCASARGETPAWPGAPSGEVNLGVSGDVAEPTSANSAAGTCPSQPCETPRRAIRRVNGNLFPIRGTCGCVRVLTVSRQVPSLSCKLMAALNCSREK